MLRVDPGGHNPIGADTPPLHLEQEQRTSRLPRMNTSDRQPVLVTGASGFIGVHLVRLLVARGRRVSCLVRADVAGRRNCVPRAPNSSLATSMTARASRGPSRRRTPGRVPPRGARAGDVCGRLHARERRGRRGGRGGVRRAGRAPGARAGLVARRRGALGRDAESRERSAAAGFGLWAQQARRRAGGRCVTPARCPSRSSGRASCSARATAGCTRCSGPIARSGLHVVCGRGDQRALADRRGGPRRMHRARGGEGRAPGAGRLGARHLLRRRGGSLACRARRRDRASTGEERAPHPSRAGMVDAGGRPAAATSCRGSAGARGGSAATRCRDLLAGSWTCSSAKARRQLGWSPAAPLADRLRETAQWYRDARWL